MTFSLPLGVSMVSKLAVAPTLAYLAARALGLAPDLVAVATIQSAMPPAVFCMVVAIEHEFEPSQVTGSVVLTTLASLLSLPFVLALIAF